MKLGEIYKYPVQGDLNKPEFATVSAWCYRMGLDHLLRDGHLHFSKEHGQITISCNDDVTIMAKELRELPFKFTIVEGDFNISHNTKLNTFKNFPDEVFGNLILSGTKVTNFHDIHKEMTGGVHEEIVMAQSNDHKSLLSIFLMDRVPLLTRSDVAKQSDARNLRYFQIINGFVEKVYMHGMDKKKALFECQSALIDEGFDEVATT